MSENPGRRAAGDGDHTVVIRSLTREYRIHTESAEVAEALGFISTCPEMSDFSLLPADIVVTGSGDRFSVTLPDGRKINGSAMQLLAELHRYTVLVVEDEFPGAPLVHGASVVTTYGRLILLGVPGSGKSTLALHLLARGFDVEGDEHVVVREHDVVARPRTMRIKTGTLPLVPEFCEAIQRSPSLPYGEGLVYAVDPNIAGRPWRLAAGSVDHLFFVDANHLGTTSAEPLSRDMAFKRLLEDCFMPDSHASLAVARLRRLVTESHCWRLSLGNLDEAEWLIRNIDSRKRPA